MRRFAPFTSPQSPRNTSTSHPPHSNIPSPPRSLLIVVFLPNVSRELRFLLIFRSNSLFVHNLSLDVAPPRGPPDNSSAFCARHRSQVLCRFFIQPLRLSQHRCPLCTFPISAARYQSVQCNLCAPFIVLLCKSHMTRLSRTLNLYLTNHQCYLKLLSIPQPEGVPWSYLNSQRAAQPAHKKQLHIFEFHQPYFHLY